MGNLCGCADLRRAGGGPMPSPAFLFKGLGSRGAGAPGGNTPVIELLPDAGFMDTPSRDVDGDLNPTSVTGGSSDVC